MVQTPSEDFCFPLYLLERFNEHRWFLLLGLLLLTAKGQVAAMCLLMAHFLSMTFEVFHLALVFKEILLRSFILQGLFELQKEGLFGLRTL